MDSSLTQSLQPETLLALETFVTQWNLDPVASNNVLIITGNQASLVTRSTLTEEIQEQETDLVLGNSLLTESTSLQDLLTTINFDDLNYPNEATSEILNSLENQEENIALTNIFEEESGQGVSSLTTTNPPEDDNLMKLQKDLTAENIESLTRESPLPVSLFADKLKEIISRIQSGTRGKDRVKQIRVLEACYQLEALRITHQDNFSRLQEIQEALQKTFNKRRTTNTLNGAKRITQLLNLCGKAKLYSTKYITLSNLQRLTDKDFEVLLGDLRTHGVRF